jgi:prolyl oligopeptidase
MSQTSTEPDAVDPFLWLEEVLGDEALSWVRERNAESARQLEDPSFAPLEREILAVLDSDAKIPYVTQEGRWLYNFWRDAKHVRGLWRRTTLAEYRKAEPGWQTVLDLDALGAAEKEHWVFHGAQFLRPGHRRCLMSLSRGGSDAVVVREFDVEAKAFVQGGFALPEAKTEVAWIDQDTLYVGTDFGPGSLTSSGYPRLAKRWKRGTPLAAAAVVFEGAATDISVSAWRDPTPGFQRDFAQRSPSFFTNETFLVGPGGKLTRLEVPLDAKSAVHREWLLVELRTAWTAGGRTFPAGALLAARLDAFLAGGRALEVLYAPTPTASLQSWSWTRGRLVLNVLDDVKSRLTVLAPTAAGWTRAPLDGAPEVGSVSASPLDELESDDLFLVATDFLTPTSLSLLSPGKPPERLKQMPSFFDATGLEVTQHFTTSTDGTRVPYFQVSRAGLALDRSHPTLLNGYGGFEISMLPTYSGGIGRGWLAKGGVYVLANIRGGGEYGPRWHQAALQRNRPRADEDFAAIAEDLVRRGVTSPKRLGVLGGSNGGLLVGNMLVRHPQLLGAVVCMVPLLDMKRYTHLLAGASWMEEYGDPDQPDQWAYIQTFSPYHKLVPGAALPPTLFVTSTRDDRVHPGHARKMMAKMRSMGYDARYFENIEGGHGGAADNRQAAHLWALAYRFLARTLGLDPDAKGK